MDLFKKAMQYYSKVGDIGYDALSTTSNGKIGHNENKGEVVLYDGKSFKPLLVFKPIYAGSYHIESGMWIWGYNNITVSKKYKRIKDQLHSTAKKLEMDIDELSNNKEIEKLQSIHYFLTNDSVSVGPKKLWDIIKIVMYVLSAKGFIAEEKGNGNGNFTVLHVFLVDQVVTHNYVKPDAKAKAASKSNPKSKSKSKSKNKKAKKKDKTKSKT